MLALPLVVPCLLLPLGLFHIAPPMFETFIGLAGLAALVGGIPYALLALGLLWWMRRKSEPQIRMAMFVAPLLMVALLGVAIVCVVVMEGAPLDAELFTAWPTQGTHSGSAISTSLLHPSSSGSQSEWVS